ncbi:DUF397 domain-containing protein [Actinocorallia sp. A-T 12471]|uniref:DUF397 domain-containing protein n=1 Tax=Actinocorallia sp. A-T 12471 TaxID=3089813 RepID=UPI0029D264B9|nr:DUF397 domain-containing protein [Actinocorallia sp. A-T 12471]MDX6739205.1 DUF397 domain-containing protein [Actinocorallia sp. A-T 12471]
MKATIAWRKSSYSKADADCVEVGRAAGHVGLRDSKHVESGHLTVPAPQFRAFVASIKASDL